MPLVTKLAPDVLLIVLNDANHEGIGSATCHALGARNDLNFSNKHRGDFASVASHVLCTGIG